MDNCQLERLFLPRHNANQILTVKSSKLTSLIKRKKKKNFLRCRKFSYQLRRFAVVSTNVYKFSLSMIRSFAVIIIWWFHPWRAPTGEESCVIIDIRTHTWKKANLPQNRSRTFIFSRRHRHRTQPEIIIPTISEKKRKEGKKLHTLRSRRSRRPFCLSMYIHPFFRCFFHRFSILIIGFVLNILWQSKIPDASPAADVS